MWSLSCLQSDSEPDTGVPTDFTQLHTKKIVFNMFFFRLVFGDNIRTIDPPCTGNSGQC